MFAGTAKIDITPTRSVIMEGMIRAHASEGVHDPLYARALVLANTKDLKDAYAVVSLDVCVITRESSDAARQMASEKTGIPTSNIILAASHTHSGPATIGTLNPAESEYVKDMENKISIAVEQAVANLKPAAVGCVSDKEDTISHYRRFLSDNGKVIMIWEANPAEVIMHVQGVIDPQLGVLKVVDVENPDRVVCLLFNHAGHPNVMSGDNYLISADYPGVTQTLLEKEYDCVAMFANGAQGTMDIDNWKYRDWEGMNKIGSDLAKAVSRAAKMAEPSKDAAIRGEHIRYTIPPRKMTEVELAWSEEILRQTGGAIQTVADGVGDDYKALLYKELHEAESRDIVVDQTCFAIGDTAFISFPGELFTEIGMRIKEKSPFQNTYIMGLADGYISYIPDHKAISQGGFEVDLRRGADNAEDLIIEQSLSLLKKVYARE